MPGFLDRIRRCLARRRPGPLHDWFHVTYDDTSVYLDVSPPGGDPWTDQLPWSSIERIAFHAEDLHTSDGIYIFTSLRPESFAVPTEANGGNELWGEILERRLFDPELAIEAASSLGGIVFWPPVEEGASAPKDAPGDRADRH